MSMYLSPLQRFVKFVLDIGVYVETGFLELLSTATCAENAYKPALLHYNATLATYMAGADPMQGALTIDPVNSPYFSGETIVDGAESKAVGCVEKLATINPCGTEYTAGGYCDGPAILKKKRAQHFMPASVFSGKLRLMIQAIYGSKRTDYEVPVDAGGVPIAYNVLNIGSTTLSSQFNPSWGLFTSANYNYWLVKVDSNVTYYPLILSATAQSILNIIAANPGLGADVIKRAECYALSTATIDTINTLSSGSISLTGTPLYYGLHWKWDGSEARVVCHEEDNVNQRYNARYYKLEVSFDSNAGTFSHTLTELANNYWWVNNGGLVGYVPLPTTGQMVAIPLVANTGGTYSGNPSVGTFDAVIHVYADASTNQFIEVSSSNDTIVRTDSKNFTPANPGPNFAGSFAGRLWHNDTVTYSGAYGSRYLHVGGVSHQVDYRSTSLERYWYSDPDAEISNPVSYYAYSQNGPLVGDGTSVLWTFQNNSAYFHQQGFFSLGNVLAGPYTWTSPGGQTYTDAYTVYVCMHKYWSRRFYRELYPTGRTKNGALCLIIPHRSCSAIFAGRNQLEHVASSDNNQVVLGSFTGKFDVGTGVVVGGSLFQSTVTFISDFTWWYVTPQLNYSFYIPPNVVGAYSNAVYSYDVLTYTHANVSTTAPSTDRFFEVDFFNYPFLDFSETVNTATGNYYSYSSGYPTTPVSSDAGGYKYDSAVGWA